ncbi:MAG: hypothetical protein AB1941_18490, partial [Gemmatimonadota bacterium]
VPPQCTHGAVPLAFALAIASSRDALPPVLWPACNFSTRPSVYQFSEAARNESWDPEFARDAEQVLVQKVEPAILDIEDSIRSAAFLSKLTERVTAEQVASGSLVAWLVDHLAASATVAAAAGATMAGGLAMLRAVQDRRKAIMEAERNHLFFYYETRRRLGGR